MVSIQVLATAISGLRKSASVKPMALNMERAGARSRPSVIPRLRCLRSMISKIHEERLEHELSSRTKRGILASARSGDTGGAGKNQDPSLCWDDKLRVKRARPAPTGRRCYPRPADAVPRPALLAHAKLPGIALR